MPLNSCLEAFSLLHHKEKEFKKKVAHYRETDPECSQFLDFFEQNQLCSYVFRLSCDTPVSQKHQDLITQFKLENPECAQIIDRFNTLNQST